MESKFPSSSCLLNEKGEGAVLLMLSMKKLERKEGRKRMRKEGEEAMEEFR
jgi:hypothetical protein